MRQTQSIEPVNSQVYIWPETLEDYAPGVRQSLILSGSTSALSSLEVYAYSIDEGLSHFGVPAPGVEYLVIVKEGQLTTEVRNSEVSLGPGSVMSVSPGELFQLNNTDNKPAAYFVFQYSSRKGTSESRSEASGGTFFIDWEQVEVKQTGKGARRHFFDQPTASLDRFEMHVTTLNEGLTSHPVHTHREEEFLLIIEGTVEEHIDGSVHEANAGDLIFLDAMVPHNITNIGTGPAVYFAFKWE